MIQNSYPRHCSTGHLGLTPSSTIYHLSLHPKLFQLCATVCHPMGHRLTGSPVHGIFQSGILEWVAMSSSRGPSQPKD